MNRSYFQLPYHQDRFNKKSGPPLPPPGRGRGHHGPPGGNQAWSGPPPVHHLWIMKKNSMGNGGPPMQSTEDDMRMEGGYLPPPRPQMSDRHGEGNFGGWSSGLGPSNYRGGDHPSFFMTEATRISVVGDHHHVISFQTILDNSIQQHRIISLHQAVGRWRRWTRSDAEVSEGVEVVCGFKEENTTTTDGEDLEKMEVISKAGQWLSRSIVVICTTFLLIC